MARRLCTTVTLGLISVAIPLRAANGPHLGTDRQNKVVWTNDDVERLRGRGLISVVGRIEEEGSTSLAASGPYLKTLDPDWYSAQAASLRDELERRQAQLREYRQALDDARTLRETTDTVNLDEGDVGISPEAGIEILKRRVNEAEMELDALEDLARRNGIPPGTLRGQ
jgi:hypothetical protein